MSSARPLSFYEPLLSSFLNSFVRSTRFRAKPGLAEVLAAEPRLIVVLNHAAPLSWLPAVALLTANACSRGGGSRRPTGVFDKFFFAVPGLRVLAGLASQSDHALSFDELVDVFGRASGTDIVIFPEGSNCFFGPSSEMQPFRSPRFIELAVRTGAPLLLCAHRGSESWGVSVPVAPEVASLSSLLPSFASSFLSSRLKSSGTFTLPGLPRPLEHFEMLCELYRPTLSLADLSDDDDVLFDQIGAEALRVHAKMESMLAEIDASWPAAVGR